MRSEILGQFAPVIYYVSWIFIGNFILLNLFLAILLDGFLAEDDDDGGDQDEMARIAKENRLIKIRKEKTRRLKKMKCDPNSIKEAKKPGLKKKFDDNTVDDVDDMDIKAIREIFMDEGLLK